MIDIDNTTINKDTTSRHINKYENQNLIHRMVLGRFLDAMAEEIKSAEKSEILDFGCGEGFFWKEMMHRGLDVENLTGIDLRDDALATAKSWFPQHEFLKQDLLDWSIGKKFDLVIASEVLEHLPAPELFLKKLLEMTSGKLLLSVPWEPFFRLANFLRGRDLLSLGNHPEHINHWGVRSFSRFVSRYAEIIKFYHVFPFLIVVCRPKA
jgi:2-polyprenyl-3-methyl-5-hydroxy-6-metoxy-1,4-benzoquinol methylase